MYNLEQTLNLSVLANLDIKVASVGGETGDGHDLGSKGIKVASTNRRSHITNGHDKAGGDTLARLGSCESEYCVLAMQMGRLPKPWAV